MISNFFRVLQNRIQNKLLLFCKTIYSHNFLFVDCRSSF